MKKLILLTLLIPSLLFAQETIEKHSDTEIKVTRQEPAKVNVIRLSILKNKKIFYETKLAEVNTQISEAVRLGVKDRKEEETKE